MDLFKFESDFANEANNPLVYVGACLLGIFCLIISLLWWFHILLYLALRDANDYPVSTFLNKFFLTLESSAMSFMGVAAFGGFCLYLVFCVMKGNVKFGIRFVIFTFHPMKKNETWMNSFLFNVLLILISSSAVV